MNFYNYKDLFHPMVTKALCWQTGEQNCSIKRAKNFKKTVLTIGSTIRDKKSIFGNSIPKSIDRIKEVSEEKRNQAKMAC